MTGLPQGWTETALGDVCELLNGRAYSQPELLSAGKYPVLRVGNLFSRNAWYHSDLELDPDKYINNGDLIYAWSASFGPRIWLGGKVIYHYHIWKCALQDQAVDKHFLYNLLLWDTAKIKGDHGVGSTMMHVTKSAMEKRQIPLPPLPEQRRIVRKLDTLSARSTTARTHLTAIKKLVERYKVAVLGQLFGKSGADPKPTEHLWAIPSNWSWRKVKDIGEVGLGRQRSPENHDGPFMRPYIRSANITWQGVDISDVKEMNFDTADFERFQLKPGDVLLNEGSGSAKEVGKPAIWRREISDCCYQNTVLRVQPRDCTSEYLYWYFLLTALSEGFVGDTKGVNIQHIGKNGLANFPIPVPPLDEQREIVRRIETAFAKIDRLAAEAAKALKLLGHLDQRLLAKTFAGDLVPQDPNDEPAETLLARIVEARAAAPKSKRGRK